MALDTLQEVTKLSKKIECCIMTRTVGYYANFHTMNKGKQSEVRDRKLFDVNNKEKTYPEWNKKKQ